MVQYYKDIRIAFIQYSSVKIVDSGSVGVTDAHKIQKIPEYFDVGYPLGQTKTVDCFRFALLVGIVYYHILEFVLYKFFQSLC